MSLVEKKAIFMEWYYIVMIVIASLVLLVLLTSLVCFFMTFYSFRGAKIDQVFLPDGEEYQRFKPQIIQDIQDARNMNYVEMSITSFDGLKLVGKYYELEKGLPMEIMFHGYKGTGERDLSTGIKRAHLCKRNALVIDQRASGGSEGHVITFGINESKDCLSWVNHCIEIGRAHV